MLIRRDRSCSVRTRIAFLSVSGKNIVNIYKQADVIGVSVQKYFSKIRES